VVGVGVGIVFLVGVKPNSNPNPNPDFDDSFLLRGYSLIPSPSSYKYKLIIK